MSVISVEMFTKANFGCRKTYVIFGPIIKKMLAIIEICHGLVYNIEGLPRLRISYINIKNKLVYQNSIQ